MQENLLQHHMFARQPVNRARLARGATNLADKNLPSLTPALATERPSRNYRDLGSVIESLSRISPASGVFISRFHERGLALVSFVDSSDILHTAKLQRSEDLSPLLRLAGTGTFAIIGGEIANGANRIRTHNFIAAAETGTGMSNRRSREASYRAWQETVSSLPKDTTEVRIISTDHNLTLDAKNGLDRYVISLNPNLGRSIQMALNDLKGFKFEAYGINGPRWRF